MPVIKSKQTLSKLWIFLFFASTAFLAFICLEPEVRKAQHSQSKLRELASTASDTSKLKKPSGALEVALEILDEHSTDSSGVSRMRLHLHSHINLKNVVVTWTLSRRLQLVEGARQTQLSSMAANQDLTFDIAVSGNPQNLEDLIEVRATSTDGGVRVGATQTIRPFLSQRNVERSDVDKRAKLFEDQSDGRAQKIME